MRPLELIEFIKAARFRVWESGYATSDKRFYIYEQLGPEESRRYGPYTNKECAIKLQVIREEFIEMITRNLVILPREEFNPNPEGTNDSM